MKIELEFEVYQPKRRTNGFDYHGSLFTERKIIYVVSVLGRVKNISDAIIKKAEKEARKRINEFEEPPEEFTFTL